MLPVPFFYTELGSLFQGDCAQLLREIPEASVDLAFADPPFNLNKTYSSNIDDNLPDAEYLGWCREWLVQLIRVLKPGGSLFLYNLPKWNLPLGAFLMQSLTFRHWITVDMKYSLPVPKRLYPSNYSLLYFIKGSAPAIFHPDRIPIECCRHCGGEQRDYGGYKDKMNPMGVNLTDVWTDIPPVRHRKYKRRAANALSVKLMDRLIAMSSDEDSLIIDPFAGSGTSLVTAEILRRRWIGVDLDCSAIVERFQNLSGDRDYLEEIRQQKNTLFTKEDLVRRKKKEIKTLTKDYRLEQSLSEPPDQEEPTLFTVPL
jgi:site-specific DNA-methyltransferase (adenine-specific)